MASEQFLGSELRIGPVPMRGRAVLAPMSGISDVAFRRIAARFGAGLVVTEMVAAAAYVARADEARLRSEGQGIQPHVVQLVGRNPRAMGAAARLAEASGAEIIDINFGCPAKKVTGGLCGSALMREPDLALAIVETVVAAVSVPVTVKMRLGWDDASRNAVVLASAAAAAGAQAVTVHGRTRQQFYSGRADWDAIGEVAAALALPVIANGDVVCAETARACLARSGAAAVMIGRAAVGQPWIVGEVAAALAGRPFAPPSWAERAGVALEHYEAMLTLYGTEMGVRHARKHLAAYADRATEAGFGLAETDRRTLLTTTEPGLVACLLRRLYAEPARLAA
ncbi:tRNA dihydrouridine synthase DusB [Enterovirga aerilata]|uniref:tRNA-dihydrouridine synthase n=1 Tax=Enterovirga aerilata TaxID=2730920 RepID=A0A849I439_9HYPH|nr:tRNA dihydrouridine synthase DusB [Enterovirga sp. DB1703]NNM72101.1 tRNA dihydrouridine synthase DusB [Enterovirga sp. DB1703]